MTDLLKAHFPLTVCVFDADGVRRNVANLQDIVDLCNEKAERYGDEMAKNFSADLVAALTPITIPAKAPAKLTEGTLPAGAKATPAPAAKKPAAPAKATGKAKGK
jgi:hypothetical protein